MILFPLFVGSLFAFVGCKSVFVFQYSVWYILVVAHHLVFSYPIECWHIISVLY